MAEYGIRHSLASTEDAQTNGQVENSNGTIIDQLVALLEGGGDHNWDLLLHDAVFAKWFG